MQLLDMCETKLYQELKQIILAKQALIQRLIYLKQIYAEAYLSAGVIRNLVWSSLHQQQYQIENTEIDVIFFDENEQNQHITQEIYEKLTQKFPENDWDVVNQALVHTWYTTEKNQAISAYLSLYEALSTWPETATAIAVRLTEHDEMEIIAPFGLSDLFGLKLRWNDRLVSHDVFIQRLRSKRFLQRWEKLRIVD